MVDIDPVKLLSKGLTPLQVVNAVNAQNLTLPGGFLSALRESEEQSPLPVRRHIRRESRRCMLSLLVDGNQCAGERLELHRKGVGNLPGGRGQARERL